jgi:hypothetical protein
VCLTIGSYTCVISGTSQAMENGGSAVNSGETK